MVPAIIRDVGVQKRPLDWKRLTHERPVSTRAPQSRAGPATLRHAHRARSLPGSSTRAHCPQLTVCRISQVLCSLYCSFGRYPVNQEEMAVKWLNGNRWQKVEAPCHGRPTRQGLLPEPGGGGALGCSSGLGGSRAGGRVLFPCPQVLPRGNADHGVGAEKGL